LQRLQHKTNEFVGIANVADIALFIAWGSVDLVRKQMEDKPQMSEMELVPRLKFADRPIVEIFISGTHSHTQGSCS
jgi:hypothetical protein